MGNQSTVTASAVTVTLAAETLVLTAPAYAVNNPGGQGISVDGAVDITAGTSTTAIVLRVRRDSVIGTVVGTITHTLAATVVGAIPFDFLDTVATALVGSPVYVLTAQQTAGSANGTISVATMNVEASTVVN